MRAAPFLLAASLLALALWLLPTFFGGQTELETAELAPASDAEARATDPLVAATREQRRSASESSDIETSSSGAPAPRVAQGSATTATAAPTPDDLRIRVVDGATRAAMPGIELQVVWEVHSASSRSTSGIKNGHTADPEGELRIPRALVEKRREQNGLEGHLLVRVKGVFAEKPELRAKVEPWPTDVLEIALPPFAWVAFDAVDELGGALDASGELELQPVREDARHSRERLELREGRTAKLLCGIGAAFEVSGTLSDGSTLEHKALRGPLAPGVIERHALRRERSGSRVAIRLLVAPGEPLRSAPISLSLEEERKSGDSSSSSSSGSSLETDGEGWLRLVLDDPSGGDGLKRTMSVSAKNAQRGRLAAFLDLSREFPPGETVLGELLLAEEPLLASGRVVDRRGRPIAAIQVRAEVLDANGAEVGSQWTGSTTDAEGRFEIRSPMPAAKTRLTARGEGYLDSAPLEVAAATRDVEITLDAAARVRGSIVLPEGMDPGAVTVSIETRGDRRAASQATAVAADGSFAIAEITPGMVDLSFHWRRAMELGTVTEVRCISGEENRDARLQGLELARGWRRLALRLLGPSGDPLAGQECQLFLDAEPRARVLRTDLEGQLEDWVPPEVPRCTLEVESYRPLSFGWMPDRQDLRLEAGIRVTLPVEAVLVPPITHLQVSLHGSASSANALVANGIAELVVPAPGSYEVRVEYARPIGGITHTSMLPLQPRLRVEIDARGDQRLPVLRIEAAQLRAALEGR
jgi:hypothetical protein